MPALTADKMMRIVAAVPEVRLAAAEKLSGITPLLDCRLLDKLTAQGVFSASVVYVGCEPLYVVWWHKTVDGGLHLNAVVQTGSASDLPALVKAAESLAVRNGRNYVRFNTRRPGLVVRAQEWGYTAESITLVKHL